MSIAPLQGATSFGPFSSETVSLRTAQSTCTFQIHKDLLMSKSKALAAAFEKGFSEQQDGVYTCSDTSNATLARFVEWAYRGDYPALLFRPRLIQTNIKVPKDSDVEHVAAEDTASGDIEPETEKYPCLTHLRLYIFSDVYLIGELKQLAFAKLTALLVSGKPKSVDAQRAVIDLLLVAFSKIPPSDPLLDWLAHYAAYCVDKLRLRSSFHNLLGVIPALRSRIIGKLNPASKPPWNGNSPEDTFPQEPRPILSPRICL